jgi:hypothetical protein
MEGIMESKRKIPPRNRKKTARKRAKIRAHKRRRKTLSHHGKRLP